MNMSNIQKADLEWCLAKIVATPIVSKKIKTVRDIYEYRAELKCIKGEVNDINHLLDLMVDAINEKLRFRQVDSIKILKKIFKNRNESQYLPKPTVDKIFRLYQHYILHPNEDVQWAVSVMLKDQKLSDDQISWLISNIDNSEHILNRVLRYPEPHKLISEWASQKINDVNAYIDRRSELVSLTIRDTIPQTPESDNSSVMAWAVYYSHNSLQIKERMLIEIIDKNNLHSVLEIAERLECPKIIEYMIDNIDNINAEQSGAGEPSAELQAP